VPNVLLGVSGGIAAYKAPELVRRLRERGAEVQVVLTHSASEFVTETSLQAVSGRPVRRSLWDRDAEAAMGHIELARWADCIVIAPATAETMARLATGSAADLLTTLCLASEAPLVIAPAMNRVMWASAAVQANRDTLEKRGARILGPESGDQACGEIGFGRMSEPDAIAAYVTGAEAVAPASDTPRLLAGKTVMITAGPTREAIDPVRYISNRSSGKMGYALARAAGQAGARVILISGPVGLAPPDEVQFVSIESAEQLFAATHKHLDGVDIFIGAAAVSDYRPGKAETHKIKKSSAEMNLDLIRSPDTLASVAKLENGPFTVGFAAETDRVRDYARGKLQNKRLDMIVANKVGPDCGFDCDDNAVEVYWHDGELALPMAPKTALARDLIRLIAERYEARADDTRTELPSLASHGD
jgi:phosphopantothenoylcysteine decarboxylase/phosphopantothenate--cysteine ligase